ncbi:MAG: Ferrochelatase [Alphaproteobacteria bacterium MarineAlpha11_Bin1]|nr:MAG: Ferrochelatase [Alphaproteobacteria bacterium MarineAlpha11_Bin1]|tara:strand:- start:7547 stop:8569 length:1023 start_codon:yes stop_codon:yes gene_type:complete
MTRIAVVLFNLGGPDSPDSVQPFLKNLFSDPMILRVPGPLRWFLSRLIAWRRAPVAREIYAEIGGRSPILPETEKQAAALQSALGEGYRVFIAMRYWHPFAASVARDVLKWSPGRIVLCPLYPQFSTTTTESFTRVWSTAAEDIGLTAPTSTICCWPDVSGFVETIARMTDAAIDSLFDNTNFRVLFSAHGLPKKIVDGGDPYPKQVERTASAILDQMKHKGIDNLVCYQSRVGPLEWLKPYTEDEIKKAGAEGRSLIIVPVAFVSEHSETLVELDIEYAELAARAGVQEYIRVPTVGAENDFIQSIASLVRTAPEIGTASGSEGCPADSKDCPLQQRST